jgi:hypothetical protein
MLAMIGVTMKPITTENGAAIGMEDQDLKTGTLVGYPNKLL